MKTNRELIQESIAHWKRMQAAGQSKSEAEANVREEQPTVGGCALCKKYQSFFDDCFKCPIRRKVGHGQCRRTPYDRAADAFYRQIGDWQACSQAEIDFLENLLLDYPESAPDGLVSAPV